ncbi:uncharacterized protein K02A2.6-like [Armigeres subalbatus]|uniref:uncharacterized protein K02A2.6-like n=1 Tax=Armigeres subalbatus TaxID=124917 RepID=UPI002ECFF3E7
MNVMATVLNALGLANWNACSLKSKIVVELSDFLQEKEIDAAFMTETHQKPEMHPQCLRSKYRFLRASKIENDEEKFDMLLVLGGLELQEFYDKITKYEVQQILQSGEVIVFQYESAITSLEKYFAPQLNKRFERHLFREMKQEENEPFHEFIFRLQDQAKRSDFMDPDDMVIDQVVEGCKSTELRKKLLTKELTLNDVMTLGKTIEEVQKQSKQYDKPSASTFERTLVQRVVDQRPDNRQNLETNRRCYNCNRPGHLAKDIGKCAANDAKCHGCGTKGHFKACCRRRKREESQQPSGPAPKRHSVNAILDEKATTKGVGIYNRGRKPAERNMKILFSDAFESEVKVPGDETGVWAHILVAPDGQTNILSKAISFALGVLNICYNINHVSNLSEGPETFPKVPNVTLKIQIDANIAPVVQVARRLPVSMEADVEEAIRGLLEKDIIERAQGPLSWVSPLVPIRKADGKIRLCVDMRAANRAVKRENYPMPNIDAAITSITKVTKLSKIDLEAAYYHFELDEDSRDITTFIARSGVYRFRRLMFGIKSAPELFQREMENLFRGIEGVIVYMDDVLIHGATDEEKKNIVKPKESAWQSFGQWKDSSCTFMA